jgi:hypothetical protein
MPGVIWAAGLREDLEDGLESTHESGRPWMHANSMRHNMLHTFSVSGRTGCPAKSRLAGKTRRAAGGGGAPHGVGATPR